MALTAVTSGLALAGQERHCSASLERAMSLKCEIFPARTRSTSYDDGAYFTLPHAFRWSVTSTVDSEPGAKSAATRSQPPKCFTRKTAMPSFSVRHRRFGALGHPAHAVRRDLDARLWLDALWAP